MADVKWIKITTDIFDDEKIRLIESLPDGDAILVVWFKLLTLAGKTNDNGQIYINYKMPMTIEMLVTLLNRKRTIIELALNTFEQFGMIEVEDFISIKNWSKHQNVQALDDIKAQNRLRQARYREKQKQLLSGEKKEKETKTVTLQSRYVTHIDKDKDKEYIYAQFDKFYSLYPKKHGKQNALKSWEKLKPDDSLCQEIMTALSQQKKSEQWTKDNGKFVPYPATWLNGRRWEDEIETKKVGGDEIPWI